MTPNEVKELAKYPSLEIRWELARKYQGQVAALMDKLAQSNSKPATKSTKPQGFKWKLVYNRCEDPPNITDPVMFASYLAANSQCWLKASGGGWIGYEPIHVTPPTLMGQYEQRAHLICGQRLEAKNAAAVEDSGSDLVEIESRDTRLADELEHWLASHDHDKAWALVARTAIQQLIQGA